MRDINWAERWIDEKTELKIYFLAKIKKCIKLFFLQILYFSLDDTHNLLFKSCVLFV